jgi:hypothetical protein
VKGGSVQSTANTAIEPWGKGMRQPPRVLVSLASHILDAKAGRFDPAKFNLLRVRENISSSRHFHGPPETGGLLRRMNVFVTVALAACPQRCTSDEADTLLSAYRD